MPLLQPGRFNEYELTAEEQQAGQFNAFHMARLHNERAIIANSMVELLLDPKQPEHFAQDQAFLRGKLALIEELMGILKPDSEVSSN